MKATWLRNGVVRDERLELHRQIGHYKGTAGVARAAPAAPRVAKGARRRRVLQPPHTLASPRARARFTRSFARPYK